jgi:glycosyltransferase involved in cell wall biosynthesis
MNQIRIAIDGNEANVKNRVGSNVYAFEILWALEKVTRQRPEMSVTVLLSDHPIKDLPISRAGWKYAVVTPKPLWTQFGLPVHLFVHKSQYDVFFTPGHYAPRLSSLPYISSVMDVAYLKFPEQFKSKDAVQLREWTEYSVKHARKVVAISESTKADVIKHYHRKPEDVVVAYPSISLMEVKQSPVRLKAFFRKQKIKSPFIVYVGTLQPRKNLIKLVEAYEKLCRKQASERAPLPQLVLAGKVGWLADELLSRIEQSTFKANIILTGFVTDEQKYALLEKAQCSVLIGTYEGFGIPPLESLTVGTVPVVANSSSLPEVVGNAGILVNPENVSSIADGLYQALTMSAKEKIKFRKQARKQLQKFSWEKSAKIILEALEEIAPK